MSDNSAGVLTVDELLALRACDARVLVMIQEQMDAYLACLAKIERNLGHVLAAIEPVNDSLADMVRKARNEARRAQGKQGANDEQ